MTRYIALGLAMLAGATLAIVGTNGLNAQGKSPGAYAVLDIAEVTDPAGLKQILVKSAPSVAAAGGQYIVRTDKITALIGSAPVRTVIIAFDSVDKAKAWYNSPAQQEVNALAHRSIKSRWYVAEGFSK